MLKGCITRESLETHGLKSRPKQSNTFSTKPCLFLLTFSRWTLIHIKRTSYQSHTNNGFFKLTVLFYTVGCKSTWLSTNRTHCLSAIPAFIIRMPQNAYYHNLKWTREDSLPCYCYEIKSNSGTICTQVSQLASADMQSNGHEWTANTSLHNTKTVNLVLVHCRRHTGVKRNFWPLRNLWPIIVFQLFLFS